MSEAIDPKELPHEFLLKRHKLTIGELSAHTQQLKKVSKLEEIKLSKKCIN